MQVKKFSLACLMLLSSVAFGQMTEKSHDLNEVVVKSTRLKDYAIGSSVQKIDSLEKQRFSTYSVADLLSTLSLVNVKSNGPGGVSEIAIRGRSSYHTAVLWNGVNIQSSMSGGVNMALLPSQFFGDVQIQYGGSGTLFGSGAAAGVIHLGNQDLFYSKNNMGLKASYGSFNSKSVFGSIKIGNEKIANRLKVNYNNADNDFEYELADGTAVEQTHAGLEQIAVMNETQFKVTSNSVLKATVWYQKYKKDIQTQISAVEPSQAFQDDDNLKLALNYVYTDNKFKLHAKSVYMADKIHYVSPAGDWPADNTHKPRTWVNEIETKYQFDRIHSIIAGYNLIYEQAKSSNYNGLITRRRHSAFVSHKMENLFERLTWVNSLRQELIDDDLGPLIFSSGMRFKIFESLLANANISRVYRIPTFNDLYWAFSGNPDLDPEKGWSFDAGLEQIFTSGIATFNFKQNFFASNLKNWIAWAPSTDNPDIWLPANKDEGETIGLDLDASVDFKFSDNSLLKMNGKYTWTESNYVNINGDVETETKMTYVPKHRFLINLGFYQKNWNIVYTHNYSDFRLTNSYTLTYEQIVMQPYFTGSLSGQYTFPFGKQSLTAALQINNIWNRNYQVIYDYAMPRRSFKFSLFYNLNL